MTRSVVQVDVAYPRVASTIIVALNYGYVGKQRARISALNVLYAQCQRVQRATEKVEVCRLLPTPARISFEGGGLFYPKSFTHEKLINKSVRQMCYTVHGPKGFCLKYVYMCLQMDRFGQKPSTPTKVDI